MAAAHASTASPRALAPCSQRPTRNARTAVPCPAHGPDDRRAYCGLVRHGPRAPGVTEADDAVAATPAAEKDPGRAGWLFGAVTVIPALLAVAWLLPAFPLLLAGRLAARPMVFMFVPLAAALCYFAVRQLPAAWRSRRCCSWLLTRKRCQSEAVRRSANNPAGSS